RETLARHNPEGGVHCGTAVDSGQIGKSDSGGGASARSQREPLARKHVLDWRDGIAFYPPGAVGCRFAWREAGAAYAGRCGGWEILGRAPFPGEAESAYQWGQGLCSETASQLRVGAGRG